jgi:membrane associated rhomboid family serine protease
MDRVDRAGVPIDICSRCRGIWLDRGELRLLSPSFLDADLHATPRTLLRWWRALTCPSCGGHVLPWSYLSEKERVEIGRCQSCKGLWIDVKLLRQLKPKKIFAGEQAELEARRRKSVGRVFSRPATLQEFFAWITGCPIDFDNPCTMTPYVTWTIIGLNIVVFLMQSFLVSDRKAFLLAWGMVPEAVFHGQVYRLVTSMFLHADVFHLAGNLFFLHTFGDNLEERFGTLRFGALYIATGVVAGLFSCVALGGSTVPRIGASGAISGIMAAYLVIFPQKHLLMGPAMFTGMLPGPLRVALWRVPTVIRLHVGAFMLFWCALNVVGWIVQTHLHAVAVDSAAHLGGFVAGLGGGYLLGLLRRRSGKPADTLSQATQ